MQQQDYQLNFKNLQLDRLIAVKKVYEQYQQNSDLPMVAKHLQNHEFNDCVLTPLKIVGNLVKPFLLLLPTLGYTHNELHVVKALHLINNATLRDELLRNADSTFMQTYVHHYMFIVNNNYIGMRKTSEWLREIFSKVALHTILALSFTDVKNKYVSEFS